MSLLSSIDVVCVVAVAAAFVTEKMNHSELLVHADIILLIDLEN